MRFAKMGGFSERVMPGQNPPRALFAAYGCGINDPPQRQAAAQFGAQGFETSLFQLPGEASAWSEVPPGLHILDMPAVPLAEWMPRSVCSIAQFLCYTRDLRRLLKRMQPNWVVTHMLHSFAAVQLAKSASPKLKCLSFIPDIPVAQDAGRLDRRINSYGWKHLRNADLVWASDGYKAELARKFGELRHCPLICHNCPTLDYLPPPVWPRDPWLRSELRNQGATIGEHGGCILLRAGAVGECGGIEETLDAMRELPSDLIFLLMGRPPPEYKTKLLGQIEQLRLQRRAFLWNRPDDETWKKALRGADIGHLIHGPFPPGPLARAYAVNSSLSNNRLFQYMAASLPIISYDDPRMVSLHNEVQCFQIARLDHLRSDIAAHLLRLASSESVRAEIGKTGRSAFERKYNWEKQFEPVLKSVVANECGN